ncbi:hypothetical protein ACFCWG_24815 [Streptomyces sp. NPDC056390]|uniref:hypothetical protein n=1 Tax=Streptomyces sp. NPDC056390 TaxID=3345806 RepID=UPI0035DFEF62
MADVLTTTAIVLAWILGYSALCALKPFGRCRRCQGEGERTTRRGRLKPCRRCHETGLRLRVGRRIHNRASALHRAGTR